MGHDDSELVERCLAEDQEACATLVETYARLVGTVIWRALGDETHVDDLAQETFLRVFRALPYFDARAKLSTWICTIAHNVAVDHLRKTGRRVEPAAVAHEDSADILERLPSGTPDPEAALSSAERERLVRDALAQLPDKYRVPIVYAAIDGLDYPRIAAILGVPVGTVKTLVFRGKQMLRRQMILTLGRHDAL